MQVQGTSESWTLTIAKENIQHKSGERMYGYYTGMFQAGHSIWKQHGLKGLYAGYDVYFLISSAMLIPFS